MLGITIIIITENSKGDHKFVVNLYSGTCVYLFIFTDDHVESGGWVVKYFCLDVLRRYEIFTQDYNISLRCITREKHQMVKLSAGFRRINKIRQCPLHSALSPETNTILKQ